MDILVTGATSLLGRGVAAALLERGDRVTCFQRRPSGLDTKEITGDIRDADAVRAAGAGHEVVVHLAALVAPRPTFAEAFAVNVDGTRNVLAAIDTDARLVHISTPSVAFHDAPSIGAPAEPASYQGRDPYARTKAIAERAVLANERCPVVVLRPHLVWGPGDTQLVGRIVARGSARRLALPDGGRALIDTTYLDDAVRAIVAGVDRSGDEPKALGRAFVISGGDPRPVYDLVTGILRAANVSWSPRSISAPLASIAGRVIGRTWPGDEPPLTHFAARQLSLAHWFDQRETQSILRWQPHIDVDQGLALLADWFRRSTTGPIER